MRRQIDCIAFDFQSITSAEPLLPIAMLAFNWRPVSLVNDCMLALTPRYSITRSHGSLDECLGSRIGWAMAVKTKKKKVPESEK